MGHGAGVVVVTAGHVGGTRGPGIVSCAADVLGMRVVREIRGIGGVCKMCTCSGGVGVEWTRRLSLGFTNPVRTGGVLDVRLCCGGVGVGREF